VKVEIYLEFETHLAPLCKLANLLDITRFAKQIFDISKKEGELLYIWIIVHHQWFLHKEITNHRAYFNVKNTNDIVDFRPDNWFNRHPHRGYFRFPYNIGPTRNKAETRESLNKAMEQENIARQTIEFLILANICETNGAKTIWETKKCVINTYGKIIYDDDSYRDHLYAVSFDTIFNKSRILIRRPLCNEGNPDTE
jgi:hypothetical protein